MEKIVHLGLDGRVRKSLDSTDPKRDAHGSPSIEHSLAPALSGHARPLRADLRGRTGGRSASSTCKTACSRWRAWARAVLKSVRPEDSAGPRRPPSTHRSVSPAFPRLIACWAVAIVGCAAGGRADPCSARRTRWRPPRRRPAPRTLRFRSTRTFWRGLPRTASDITCVGRGYRREAPSWRSSSKPGGLTRATASRVSAIWCSIWRSAGRCVSKPTNSLESVRLLGYRPTPDQNVDTSFDNTVYGLALPANAREATTSVALDLMVDWSSALSFEPAQVERERQVVLGEMRTTGGSSQRRAQQTLDVLLRRSGSDREVSTSAETVSSGTSMRLRFTDFMTTSTDRNGWPSLPLASSNRRRWNRRFEIAFPDSRPAGLSLRGWAPPLKENPKRRLPPLQHRSQKRQRTRTTRRRRSPRINLRRSRPVAISIGFNNPRSPVRTRADVRRRLIETVYGELVQARLDKLVQRSGSPLTAARWFAVPQVPTLLSVVQAVVKPGRVETGLQVLWADLHKIGAGGFAPGELASAQTAVKRSAAAGPGRDSGGDGANYGRRMTANFLWGDALLTPEDDRALRENLLGQIGLSEINQFALSMSRSAVKAVLASGPKRELRSEATLRAAVARAESADPQSLPVGASGDVLMDALPDSGLRRSRRDDRRARSATRLDSLERWFDRGHQVDTIQAVAKSCFRRRAAGGDLSGLGDRDYWSATFAPQVVTKPAGWGPTGPRFSESSKGATPRGIPGSPRRSKALPVGRLPTIWSS